MTKQDAQAMIEAATKAARAEVRMNRHHNEGGEGYESSTASGKLSTALAAIKAAGYYIRHSGMVIDAADFAAARPALVSAAVGCKTPAAVNAAFAKVSGGWTYSEFVEAKSALAK